MRAFATALTALLLAVLAPACDDGEEADPGAGATQTPAATEPTSGGGADPGDSADSGEPPEVAPERVVELVLTDAGDAAQACGALVTQRFLARAYGGRRNCVESRVPAALARGVEVEIVEGSTAAAEALAVPEGGPYDGAEVEVGLVLEDGTWRIDSLRADIPAGP